MNLPDLTNMPPPAMVRIYLAIRDRRDERKRAYERDIAGLDTMMETLETTMQAYMNSQGLKSVPTEFGTIVQTTATNASVTDWDAFYAYVLKTGRVDFLQKRPSSTTLAEYQTETGSAPPGTSFFVQRKVQVRKPSTNI